MEVNDYVRTEWGDIERIVRIDNDNIIVEIEEDEDGRTYSKMCYKENIIKSSPNIIDILEVGDYVNGLKVIQMYSPEGKYTLWIKLSDNTFIDNSEDIKSITTKEQFKNIEYEVKK